MIPAAGEGIVVQGITGRQGAFWTERMLGCGTNVVAGVTPGRAGSEVHGVPVYDSVSAAVSGHSATTTVLFTPPLSTKAAALEALAAGIKRVVMLTEFVPVHDTMWIAAAARECGAEVLGPNTAGLVVPGECAIGIMPGFATNVFRRGEVGVISRSGSLGTLICLNLVSAGLGESAFLGLGGDPVVGFSTSQAVAELAAHSRTAAIVLVGEVGGRMEEDAAELIATVSKPVAAFIAGRAAPPGRRMGHAGAIVADGKGDAASKGRVLEEAGAMVAETPGEVASGLKDALNSGHR